MYMKMDDCVFFPQADADFIMQSILPKKCQRSD